MSDSKPSSAWDQLFPDGDAEGELWAGSFLLTEEEKLKFTDGKSREELIKDLKRLELAMDDYSELLIEKQIRAERLKSKIQKRKSANQDLEIQLASKLLELIEQAKNLQAANEKKNVLEQIQKIEVELSR